MPDESAIGLVEGARNLFRATVGLVYPTLCLGCEVRIPENPDDGLPICPACLRRLPRATPEQINKRLARLPEAGGVFNMVFALWVFDEGGTIQRLQHALKYQNRPQLGIRLGKYLARALNQSLDQPLYDAVFPVPLARGRQLERGGILLSQLGDVVKKPKLNGHDDGGFAGEVFTRDNVKAGKVKGE